MPKPNVITVAHIGHSEGAHTPEMSNASMTSYVKGTMLSHPIRIADGATLSRGRRTTRYQGNSTGLTKNAHPKNANPAEDYWKIFRIPAMIVIITSGPQHDIAVQIS